MKLGDCRTADPADDRANPSLKLRATSMALAVVFLAILAGVGAVLLGAPVRSAQTIARLLGSPAAVEPGQPEPYWGHAEAQVNGDVLARADANVVCDVQSSYYQSGKGGGWKERDRSAIRLGAPTLVLRDGRVVALANDATQLEPFQPGELFGSTESEVRALTRSQGPRIAVQCLRAGTVFVDGCVYPSVGAALPVLGRCTDSTALTLTQGPRRERLAVLARGLALALGLVAAGLSGLLWFAIERLRGRSSEAGLALAVGLAPRGLGGVASLAARRRLNWYRLAPWALVPVSFWLLAAVSPMPSTLGWASLGIVAPVVLASLARRRRAQLAELRQAILDRPTSDLASAEGDLVELAVRISADAPVRPSVLGEQPAAHCSVQIWQRVVRGSGRNQSIHYEHVFSSVVFGAELPIEDSTGGGTLSLSEAILDFPARQTVAPWRELPAGVRELTNLVVGDYLVRESVLLPGDSLFVMGPVRRTPDAQAAGRFAYRAAPTRARVANTDHAAPPQGSWAPGSGADDDPERFPLFVHAGTEATMNAALDRGIARETSAVLAAWIFAGLVGTCLAGLALLCLV